MRWLPLALIVVSNVLYHLGQKAVPRGAHPVVAAILHNVGSLIVVFNSARLVRHGEELEPFQTAPQRSSDPTPPAQPGGGIPQLVLSRIAGPFTLGGMDIVPVTLVIIFLLLIVAFRSVGESLLIMLSVPFAMVGGVFLQWLLGYSMTTAVVVGYISLFAIAVQTGIIMVIFIRDALANRGADESYIDAVIRGSAWRLRPKLMTVAAIVLSLLPVMFSNGAGMEIMKPIAAPSIGGMVTSSLHVR